MARLYVDLDGVLCDFEAGARAVLGMPVGTFRDLHGERLLWKTLERAESFYERLPWLSEGRLLWDGVRSIRPGPVILTGLPLGDWAAPQKRLWCARELGPGVPVITCMTREKHSFCLPGDVLIDDRDKLRPAWEARGGVFVHHRSAAETIERVRAVMFSGTEAGKVAEKVAKAEAGKSEGKLQSGLFKSAVTGKFVSAAYAAANPATTYRVGR